MEEKKWNCKQSDLLVELVDESEVGREEIDTGWGREM